MSQSSIRIPYISFIQKIVWLLEPSVDDGTEKAPEESAAPEEESSEVAAPEAEQPQEPQTEEDLLTGGSEATGAAQQDEQYKNMIAENMDDIFN